jgi:hypothetical protein
MDWDDIESSAVVRARCARKAPSPPAQRNDAASPAGCVPEPETPTQQQSAPVPPTRSRAQPHRAIVNYVGSSARSPLPLGSRSAPDQNPTDGNHRCSQCRQQNERAGGPEDRRGDLNCQSSDDQTETDASRPPQTHGFGSACQKSRASTAARSCPEAWHLRQDNAPDAIWVLTARWAGASR